MNHSYNLEIKNLSKHYSLKNGTNFDTLKDININVKKGEFISIIGPSGSGKSTLFNIISGLEKPSSGNILLDGKSIINSKGNVGYMQQRDYLLPWRTIIDNVILGMEIKGVKKDTARKEALKYLKIFGLESFKDEYPSSLSGGMRQRAALLRTILLNKDVLLLDEPFGALDEIIRFNMQNWLLSIWEQYKNTIIFVTHSIDEAIFLSDTVYVFSSRPAYVKYKVDINLSRKRDSSIITDKRFIEIKKELLEQLT